eukprot:TRINITY_DN3337_c1_g1_i5.p3 TRINITY_DN3337_c1_g1~~TRINITY_DN3337_c1_g1_i5.p3  ORF type:complete len:299 (+),score=36.87 TRINITY_DN3337_c1_g1_i5:211-1107(+)
MSSSASPRATAPTPVCFDVCVCVSLPSPTDSHPTAPQSERSSSRRPTSPLSQSPPTTDTRPSSISKSALAGRRGQPGRQKGLDGAALGCLPQPHRHLRAPPPARSPFLPAQHCAHKPHTRTHTRTHAHTRREPTSTRRTKTVCLCVCLCVCLSVRAPAHSAARAPFLATPGFTALHFACQANKPELVALLLKLVLPPQSQVPPSPLLTAACTTGRAHRPQDQTLRGKDASGHRQAVRRRHDRVCPAADRADEEHGLLCVGEPPLTHTVPHPGHLVAGLMLKHRARETAEVVVVVVQAR